MKLTDRQRQNLARTLFNAANVILAIVILGPFVSKEVPKIGKLIFGLVAYIALLVIGTILDKGE